MNAKHLFRKQEEIDLFYDLYSIGEKPKRIESLQEAFQQKMSVRDRVHALYQTPLLSESWLNGSKRVSMHGFDFTFDYQRLGLKLVSDNPFQKIYPTLGAHAGTQSYGIFANSCQGVISTLFHTLRLLGGRADVKMFHGGYWETLKFLETIGYQVSPEKGNIVYLDSCLEPEGEVDAGELADSLKKARLFILDTTCYPMNSTKLRDKVRLSIKHGVPCALLRSHMKIDSLGMEYGRLGSFVLVWGKDFSKGKKKFCAKLTELFHELARFHGNYASLRQIYPFYNSKAFQRINANWQQALTSNHLAMREVLKEGFGSPKRLVELRTFDHGYFFWILINRGFSEAERHRMYSRLFYALSFWKIPLKQVASYPWDLLGLTYFGSRYTFLQTPREKTVIRISAGDLGKDVSAQAARAILEWVPWLERQIGG